VVFGSKNAQSGIIISFRVALNAYVVQRLRIYKMSIRVPALAAGERVQDPFLHLTSSACDVRLRDNR